MEKELNNIHPHLVYSHDVHLDSDYTQWLVELKNRYRSAQIKSAVKVNVEKLLFNWQLGRDLVLNRAEERWGAGVVEHVPLDLQNEFPRDQGFLARNLWDMKKWYLYYSTDESIQKLRQLVEEIPISVIKNIYGVMEWLIGRIFTNISIKKQIIYFA